MTEKENSREDLHPYPSQDGGVAWGPVAAVVGTILIYFISQYAAALLIIIYPALKHWNGQQATDWLNSSVAAQFINIALVEGAVVWLLSIFLHGRKVTFASLGWNRRPALTDLMYALAGFGIYFLALNFIIFPFTEKLFPTLININQKQDIGFTNAHSGLELVIVFLSLVILPPLVEETLVRGFLYTGLKTKLPKVIAAFIASIMFATAHLQIGSGSTLLWSAAVDTFILSLVLIYLRDKTNSLWSSVCVHMLKNGLAFLALFVFH